MGLTPCQKSGGSLRLSPELAQWHWRRRRFRQNQTTHCLKAKSPGRNAEAFRLSNPVR
jgi:hypothetical protein